MRIALGLPSRVASASGELMLEWVTRADRGPFSSVVVTDRVVSQALEPLSVLAMAAGATRRIRLMTSVVIGPTRETTLLARQAATMDSLSGGRLTLGLGIGVRENDYQATGFAFRRRGSRLDEQLPILRRLWAGKPLSDEVGPIGPPTRRPGKPRWVGASYFALGPSALDHASRYIAANYGYNPALAARRLRGIPTTREAVKEAIKRQVDMGVDEFILRPCADDLDQMERLAEVAARLA